MQDGPPLPNQHLPHIGDIGYLGFLRHPRHLALRWGNTGVDHGGRTRAVFISHFHISSCIGQHGVTECRHRSVDRVIDVFAFSCHPWRATGRLPYNNDNYQYFFLEALRFDWHLSSLSAGA